MTARFVSKQSALHQSSWLDSWESSLPAQMGHEFKFVSFLSLFLFQTRRNQLNFSEDCGMYFTWQWHFVFFDYSNCCPEVVPVSRHFRPIKSITRDNCKFAACNFCKFQEEKRKWQFVLMSLFQKAFHSEELLSMFLSHPFVDFNAAVWAGEGVHTSGSNKGQPFSSSWGVRKESLPYLPVQRTNMFWFIENNFARRFGQEQEKCWGTKANTFWN